MPCCTLLMCGAAAVPSCPVVLRVQGAVAAVERRHADELREELQDTRDLCAFYQQENEELNMVAMMYQRQLDQVKTQLAPKPSLLGGRGPSRVLGCLYQQPPAVFLGMGLGVAGRVRCCDGHAAMLSGKLLAPGPCPPRRQDNDLRLCWHKTTCPPPASQGSDFLLSASLLPSSAALLAVPDRDRGRDRLTGSRDARPFDRSSDRDRPAPPQDRSTADRDRDRDRDRTAERPRDKTAERSRDGERSGDARPPAPRERESYDIDRSTAGRGVGYAGGRFDMRGGGRGRGRGRNISAQYAGAKRPR